jgi:hypothetical protein
MNEKKQFTPRVHQFTNDVVYGKSLLDLSDKKQTENKKILTLMIELNETEKMKDLVKCDWRHPWEKYDYEENE